MFYAYLFLELRLFGQEEELLDLKSRRDKVFYNVYLKRQNLSIIISINQLHYHENT